MNMVKQVANLKNCMITLEKVQKFAANILSINAVKNLQNFSTIWKRETIFVKLLKRCWAMEKK